jgi:hypothetical protein
LPFLRFYNANPYLLKKLFLISSYFLLFALVNLSWAPKTEETLVASASIINPSTYSTIEEKASLLYADLHLEEMGLSKDAFQYAYKGYDRLVDKHIVSNADYLTICDFSQSSNNKRLYVIDLATNEVVINTYVAHGRNSGSEFATKFSNKPSSLQSSLGFYVTEDTYSGEHGLSLKINGLEKGINDRALGRNIVIHGADYIGDAWLNYNDYMGRSYGCPAVPLAERDEIINTIKNGTCLFIYHPSMKYLKGSKILNG